MQVDHHDLHHEFPEMIDAIHALKTGNAHFAKLFDSYHRLTGKVEDLVRWARKSSLWPMTSGSPAALMAPQ